MSICKECQMFVPNEEDLKKGDCVREQVDLKGGKFWSSKPVMADMVADNCPGFKKV